jgi:hypothetical protein
MYRVLHVVPSYRRIDLLKRYLDTFVEHVQGKSKYNHAVFVLAQGYNEKEVEYLYLNYSEVVPALVIHFSSPYPRPVSDMGIRADALGMALRTFSNPTAVMTMDDDMEFRDGSAASYDAGLEYMLQHPGVGGVRFGGFLGGYYERDGHLLANWALHAFTDLGLMWKMIPEGIMDLEMASLRPIGGFYERNMQSWMFRHGYGMVMARNCPTLHRASHYKKDSKRETVGNQDSWNHEEGNRLVMELINLSYQKFSGHPEHVIELKSVDPTLNVATFGPSLQAFAKHCHAAIERGFDPIYVHSAGKYARNLPSGWLQTWNGMKSQRDMRGAKSEAGTASAQL